MWSEELVLFKKQIMTGQLQDWINYLPWYMADTTEAQEVCGACLLLLIFHLVDISAYFICKLLLGLELPRMKSNPAELG